MLLEHLSAEGWDIHPSLEPGATPLGVRPARDPSRWQHPELSMDGALLFEAARAQTSVDVVRPMPSGRIGSAHTLGRRRAKSHAQHHRRDERKST